MIVWLASFPRSGNTFLRIALRRTYGVRSSVIYDRDGVADRIGGELVGFEPRPGDVDVMRASSATHFIKTHRQRDEQIHDDDKIIYLVRDGRDALVSWARLLSEDQPEAFERKLRECIERDERRGTGGWGANVLSWLELPARHQTIMRFEDLIATPDAVVARAISQLLPEWRPVDDESIPSFSDLRQTDRRFFRKGQSGAWGDEMPSAMQDLFWSKPENERAMTAFNYQ